MAGTCTNIVYHIVFSTKSRQPFLAPEVSSRIYSYLGGAIRDEKGVLYEIGGMDDHIHVLIRWRPDESISNLVGSVKRNATIWIHDTFPDLSDFYWQEGYGGFTVSEAESPQPLRGSSCGGTLTGGIASLIPRLHATAPSGQFV